MLGLPASTALKKSLPKKKVLEHFGAEMSSDRKKRFDSEIARMVIVGEVSPASVNLREGAEIQSFFVMLITLKSKDFDTENLAYIAKLFGQKLLMVLQAENMQRLAVWQGRLLMNDWKNADEYRIMLSGDSLDTAWACIVAEVAKLPRDDCHTLNERLEIADKRAKIEKEIIRLEKMARMERQPRKKMEIVGKIRKMKQEIQAETKNDFL